MQDWLRYVVVAFGILFFVAHLASVVLSLRYAQSRDDRLEFIGKVIPGLAGLIVAVMVFVTSTLVGITLALIALTTMIFGRAVYELIVFRRTD